MSTFPKPCQFVHVKREFNIAADFVGREAKRLGRSVSLADVNLDHLVCKGGVYLFYKPTMSDDEVW